jgi:uncharacterized damage-inducible protein DinB
MLKIVQNSGKFVAFKQEKIFHTHSFYSTPGANAPDYFAMNFTIEKSLEILERTPSVLTSLLSGLSDDWVMNNEGGDSWSPYDVLGHLVHGERTDWIPRMKLILEKGISQPFAPFDRFAQFEESKGKTLSVLLEEFTRLRKENLRNLESNLLDEDALSIEGIHPAFGVVTLHQLLATWTVHDLGHIAQISRVMAKQYSLEVGPWVAYLGILKANKS